MTEISRGAEALASAYEAAIRRFTVVLNPARLPDDHELHSIDDLALYLGGSGDSWTGSFLKLLAKSDPEHKAGLARGFPVHVLAFDTWHRTSPTVGALTAALQPALEYLGVTVG